MNSLDDRYGSTYRIRAFATQFKKNNLPTTYFEKRYSFFIKLFAMPWMTLTTSFDILVIQKFNPLTFLPILIAKLRSKYVVADWDDWDTGLQKNTVLKLATWICEKTLPFAPDLITSHNSFLLSQVPKWKQKLLLEQGFDPELFDKKNSQQNQKEIRIGYMCTFTHGGTLDLDDILIEISKINNPIIQFIIIGGGSLLKSFQQRSKNLKIKNIEFTGHIDHEKIPSILQSLDIGLIYMKDSKPNKSRVSFKVIEYLASGLPILGQTSGETKTLFEKYIEHCPLNHLSTYLNTLSRNNLPSKRIPNGLLNGFTWSSIMDKLIHHLQTAKD